MTFFNKVFILSLSGALFLIIGCASVSNFQTGKPLGKGNVQGYCAVSHITTEGNPISIAELVEIQPEFTFFEIGAMVGVTDKIDLGLKYTFPTSGLFDSKFCLLGAGKERGFFLSPGVRAGYSSISSSDNFDDSDNSKKNTRIELSVPVYLTMNFSEFFSLSLIPTYSGRYITEDSYYSNLLGGNLNMKIGKKFGIVIDAAVYHNFKWEWQEIQGGGAVFFPLPSFNFL